MKYQVQWSWLSVSSLFHNGKDVGVALRTWKGLNREASLVVLIMSDAKEAVLQKGCFFVQEASCTSLSAVLLKTLQGAWEEGNRADRGL